MGKKKARAEQSGGASEEQQYLLPTQQRNKIDSYLPLFGTREKIVIPPQELNLIKSKRSTSVHKLPQLPATAICGNDILSSCLYVCGAVAEKGGVMAPINFAIIVGMLYMFRAIYGEAVSALPMNGGCYNVLINTTSKQTAAFAATLSILSYIATGVVSATSANNYLAGIIEGYPVVPATVALLFAFAVLNFIGITESARVAVGIFVVHIITLSVLVVSSVFYAVTHTEIFSENWTTAWPNVNLGGIFHQGTFGTALFFGCATAMLGISGFESSSQFVQEQEEGVFPKTLRNMWMGVAFFNPLLSLLSLSVLRLNGPGGILATKDNILAQMGRVSGGEWLYYWITIDAFIVLSGAVLTAYVGIGGLIRRMASDRCLPRFLLATNSWRGTNHFIIFGFFAISASLEIIVAGDTAALAGVYTYAFLSLLCLFTVGTMMLKYKRPDLPREEECPWWKLFLAIVCAGIGFIGNLLGDPRVLTYFALYWLAVIAVVLTMFMRKQFLRLLFYAMRNVFPSRHDPSVQHTGARGGRTIRRLYEEVTDRPIVFFAKLPDISLINKAVLYVRNNEDTHHLYVVHVHSAKSDSRMSKFVETINILDTIYPKMKLDLVSVEGEFGPDVIEWISQKYNIPKNLMFVKSPDVDSAHKINALGGVRVITG